MISSIQNEKIKEIIKLKNKSVRDELGLFIVEGDHLVDEAYNTKHLIEIYTIDERYRLEDIPITCVTNNVMEKLSSQKSTPKIIGIVKRKEIEDITGNVLILDQIQDPGNLGTIIRSAVAFNVQTIILSPGSVDLYNEKVIRSTEGFIFKLNVIVKPLVEAINYLKNDDYKIIGSDMNGNELNSVSKYALIMGNEGKGISDEVLSLCDQVVSIKMNKDCESLNVGVATGILLYELSKGEK